MPVRDLIEYLSRWPEDAVAAFIIADVASRKIYQVKELSGITDREVPVICLDIGDPEDFDEEEKKTAEECEMNGNH